MELMEVTIINDIKVTVPDVLNLMTPFVLQEQGDWFEDEIKFLRTYIKPGMKVIDIGANYGTYTLTMAKIIGDTGRLWAFEPASATADCLDQSINNNNFKNIKLIRAGLSNKAGKAKLFLSTNSELNSMTKDAGQAAGTETIKLLTLDSCLNDYKWQSIDFIKLDAEGEESNILKKGKNTLGSLSPLIMFELKHGNIVNQPLISKFNELGYDCYRLVPGINVLVPFDKDDAIDGYLLNLFACKKDTAVKLESEGVIVRDWEQNDIPQQVTVNDELNQYGYWSDLKEMNLVSNDTNYLWVLKQYLLSLSEENNSNERLNFLMGALEGAKDILKKGEQTIARIATFSRIAFDAGERSLGVDLLRTMINKHHQKLDFDVAEPFLPACKRYDGVLPGDKVKEWIFSSMAEQYILKNTFSNYFAGEKSIPLFALLENLGFMGEDMKKRQKLVTTTFA